MKNIILTLITTSVLMLALTVNAQNLMGSEVFNNLNHTNEANGETSNLDVIIAFDNSDSMEFHVSTLEFYINSYFYEVLNPTHFNTRIILVSADSIDNEGICLPAPLGSGVCPADENLPSYQHVNHTVSGDSALSGILSTYNQWDQSLRSNSKRVVIVISDGNADMSADAFISALMALDNDFSGFQFHAIGLIPVDGCQNPSDFSTVYKQLTDLTNGLLLYIYLEFFDGVWNRKAEQITDSIFKSRFECIGY